MTSSRDVLARLPRFRALAPDEGLPMVAATPAATVIVVRPKVGAVPQAEASTGLEVWLMHRRPTMPFAPNVAAFPGGGLDPVDRSAPDPWRACAVRELAEETTLELPTHALSPWAHWITPLHQPRRYDTWFYLAVVEAGTALHDVSGEADDAYWVDPLQALADFDAGSLQLMAPTVAGLRELADASDLPTLLAEAAERVVVPIRPCAVELDGQWWIDYPDVDPDDPELSAEAFGHSGAEKAGGEAKGDTA